MFDSAEFRKWKKERNERPAPPPRPPAPALAAPPLPFVPPLAPAAGTGWVGQRFEAIDRKLDTLGGKIDQLLKAWGGRMKVVKGESFETAGPLDILVDALQDIADHPGGALIAIIYAVPAEAGGEIRVAENNMSSKAARGLAEAFGRMADVKAIEETAGGVKH